MSMPAAPPKVLRVAATAVGLLVVAQLPTFLVAGLAVQIQDELSFGPTHLGLAVGGSLGVSTIGSVAAARVVQRRGWQSGLRWTAVLGASSLAVIGLVAHTWTILFVGLLLAGVAKAFGHPSANLVLIDRAPLGRHGILFGLKQSGVPATSMIAGLSVPLIAATLGWRWTFLFASVLSLTLVALPMRGESSQRQPITVRRRRQLEVKERPILIQLSVAVGIAVAAPNTVAAFLTTYATKEGLSVEGAGLLLAGASLAGIAVRLGIGWKADQRHLGMNAVVALIFLGTLGILTMLVLGAAFLVIGAILALGAGWGWAGLFNQLVATRYTSYAAVATGFTQTGIFAGAALGPMAFGWAAEYYGFAPAWLLVALLSAAGGCMLWWIEYR